MIRSVSLAGADTIMINSRVLFDLTDGDAVKITYDEDRAVVKRGKNGNVIYALKEMGALAKCEIRLLLGSADDKYLNSFIQRMALDFSGFTLLTGLFNKRVGDGSGNITNVIYQLSGGIMTRFPDAKTSAEGDTEQSSAVFHIHYGDSQRIVA